MKIKFMPTGQEIDGNPNKTLLQLCTDNNIEIRSICKGVPSCAECRVRITSGENNLIPPNRAELSLIGTNYFLDGRRLSCQVRCFGSITVDLTEQIERTDSPNKKVRGFRNQAGKQAETQAVQGTLVLEEKPQPQQSGRQAAAHDPQTGESPNEFESDGGEESAASGESQAPAGQAREDGGKSGGGGGRGRNQQGRNRDGGGRNQQQAKGGGGQGRGQGKGQGGGRNNQQQAKGGGGQGRGQGQQGGGAGGGQGRGQQQGGQNRGQQAGGGQGRGQDGSRQNQNQNQNRNQQPKGQERGPKSEG